MGIIHKIISKLSQLFDVSISSPQEGDLLTYDAGSDTWRNEAALADIEALLDDIEATLATFPEDVADSATQIITLAPLTGGGNLSADRTITIAAATGESPGAMSGADKAKLDAANSGGTPLTLLMTDGDGGFLAGEVGVSGLTVNADYGINNTGLIFGSSLSIAAGGATIDTNGISTVQQLQVNGAITASFGTIRAEAGIGFGLGFEVANSDLSTTVFSVDDVGAVTAANGQFTVASTGDLDIGAGTFAVSVASGLIAGSGSVSLAGGSFQVDAGTGVTSVADVQCVSLNAGSHVETAQLLLSGDFSYVISNAAGGDLLNVNEVVKANWDAVLEDYYAVFHAPAAASTSAELNASQFSFYLDEGTNTLKVKVKYAGGTVKTGSIALT